MTKTVRIRLKSNPESTRVITERSWANYDKRKWEAVGIQEPQATPVQKKSVVEPVAEVTEFKSPVAIEKTTGSDFIPETHDDLGFTNPVPSELDELRATYEAKFGKPADKRMKEDKLKKMIDEAV